MAASILSYGFFTAPVAPPKITLLSRTQSGVLADAGGALTSYPFVAGIYSFMADISGDGSAAVFASDATNLVPGDGNGIADIFHRNNATGALQRVNVGSAGEQANGSSTATSVYTPSLSADGRYVLFMSDASNLVAGDGNGQVDVFLRDTQAGATRRVSTTAADQQVAAGAYGGQISADGRYAVMVSGGPMSAEDTNTYADVYRKNLQTGAIDLVSRKANGDIANSFSREPRISADGNIVLFYSDEALVADGLGNGWFIRNMTTGAYTRPDVNASGVKSSGTGNVVLSGDGRFAAFESGDRALVSGVPAGGTNVIYLKNFVTGALSLQDTTTAGVLPPGNERIGELSNDGRFLSFYSSAPLDADTWIGGIFRKDNLTGETTLVSRSDTGDALVGSNNFTPAAMTGDGSGILFSTGSNLAQPALPNPAVPVDRLYLADAATIGAGASRGDGRYLGLEVSVSGATQVRTTFGTEFGIGDGAFLANTGPATVRLGYDYLADGLYSVSIQAFDGATATATQTFDVRVALNAAAGAVLSAPVVFGGNLGNTLFGAGTMPNLLTGGLGADVLVGDGPLSLTAAAQSIKRLYVATLDRAPDGNGWRTWTGALEGGESLDSIAQGFVGSQEFQTKYGALTNAAFATLLYQNVLDRNPDAGGLAAFTQALDSGQLTRTAMVVQFSESAEFKAGTSPELHAGQIFRLYGATLARAPDAVGFEGWTDALGGGRGLVDIAAGFVGSSEFQTRYGALDNTGFVTLLYQNVLGRAPDQAGLDGWRSQLDSGALSRTQVVAGFSESGEYVAGTRAGLDAFVRATMANWSDTLNGGAGDDKLTGGRGSDLFVFTQSEGGNDTIYGFESFDTLQLNGYGFAAPAAALSAMSQQGANVVLSYAGGSITFEATQLSTLQSLPAQGWVLG